MATTHPLQNLKALRLSKGVSREAMADAISVAPTSYDRYENGTRRIYFDKACALADTLGVSLDEFRKEPGPDDTVVAQAELAGWEAPEL